ncbi:MAG TPA: gliding motility-associated ABC transporter substrate-binding protein GldG [Bacteroidales bacterium]|nr:gliding motility-associated ABC transporter substrate-binding protein GldG [Bacteroidales bacterium]
MEKKEIIDILPGNVRTRSWMQFVSASVAAIAFAVVASMLNIRLDLTEDHRYTLSGPTHRVLDKLKNDVYLQVYLDGDMPVQFKKLKRSVREILDEFRVASGRKIDYEFINPSSAGDAKERNKQYETLIGKGLQEYNVHSSDAGGGSSQRLIFPGLIVNYNGIEVPVNFLKNNTNRSADQRLLNSIEGFEYELVQTISTIASDSVKRVAFVEGHDELTGIEVADITLALSNYFFVDRSVINGRPGVLDKYSAIVIASPRRSFDEKDKLVVDQYIMNGGKVLWLFNEVAVNEDSLRFGETVAMFKPLNIEDQLFKYGVRVNPSVVQDIECVPIPMKVVTGNSRQQIVPVPWIYYPLLYPSQENPVTRNINRVAGKYTNCIDTVGRDPEVKKQVLLSTSKNTRLVNPPVLITLREADITPAEREFTRSSLPVAVMLSGTFRSLYENRIITSLVSDRNFSFKALSKPTRMIIVADGSMIRNDISRAGRREVPLPLGQDRLTSQVYGNKDFLVNCINSLVDDDGLMQLRSREMKLRLLDRKAVKNKKGMIELVNVLLPLLLVALAGLLFSFYRKRTYTRAVR